MTRQLYDTYAKKRLSKGKIVATEGALFRAEGLSGVMLNELVILETGAQGFVFGISKDGCDIVLLTGETPSPGMQVIRTGETVTFPVSMELLGHIITPLSLDYTQQEIHQGEKVPVEQRALGIAHRAKIADECMTGSLLVDLLLPLGKGQRELLLGDRKTGKTHFAIDTLITQARQGTLCIYVAIGKPLHSVKELALKLEKAGVSEKTVIIATSPEDPSGLIHLAPFAGMRLAEYFRDQGHDSLIILDDLSIHARSYRQVSLLARRFPGRNSYPGDIFYLHARLLERAGNFKQSDTKNVSITCLPIVETQLSDLTGYIQTNIMSMTDGHLYFDEERFLEGARPAIHPFLSVTRVGRQTKSHLWRQTISDLTSFLTKAERLHQVSHFGQELSEDAKTTLEKAEKLNLLFSIPEFGHTPPSFQFCILALIWFGYWLHSYNDVVLADIEKLGSLTKTKEHAQRLEELLTLDSLTTAGPKAKELADQLFAQQ